MKQDYVLVFDVEVAALSRDQLSFWTGTRVVSLCGWVKSGRTGKKNWRRQKKQN